MIYPHTVRETSFLKPDENRIVNLDEKLLFVYGCSAFDDKGTKITGVGIAYGVNEEEAKEEAWRSFYEACPLCMGFRDHELVPKEITPKALARIGYRRVTN